MTEITIDAVLVHDSTNIETFKINVTQKNLDKVTEKLNDEYKIMIQILKDYNAAGLIKSIRFPRNKKIQSQLDTIVKAKRQINKSLTLIKEIFKY